MAFSDWLVGNQDDIEFVYLVEIEPGHRLDTHTWHLDGGDGAAYHTHLTEADHERIEADGEVYVEKANKADCIATASSWYWDPAGLLYVHAKNGDSPINYIVMDYFWEYITNRQYEEPNPIVFNGKWYLPYLDESSVPDITLEATEFYEGGLNQSFGSIRVINTGYFDTRLNDYIYEGKRIFFKVGVKGAPYADYATFWRGWTGGITWMETELDVEVEDMRKCIE